MAKKFWVDDNSEKTLQEGFEEFITFCRIKNLSPATVRSYNQRFTAFMDWFNGNIADINQESINQFILLLQANCNSVNINTYLRHIRAVLNYWVKLGYMQRVQVPMQKVQQSVKDCYTIDELKILLKRPAPRSEFTEYRNWAIINMYVAFGCRVSTLINIQNKDIDFENSLITFSHTKNKRTQIIPMSPQLVAVLREYMGLRKGSAQDYLFPAVTDTKLNPNGVYQAIAKYNQRRGVIKKGSHLFRHTFVKNWLVNSKGEILSLKRITGHTTTKVLEGYANLFGEDLRATYEEYNLLDKIKTERIKL